MKKSLSYLITIFVLIACNQSKRSGDNGIIDTVGITPDSIVETRPHKGLDCSAFKFNNVREQADTLMKYVDKKQWAADEIFFCAFPNSFKEMQAIFGYDDQKGAAPLYYDPYGENMIAYFAQLNSIPKEVYYDKYINICVDGVWDADNIGEAFGFANRLLNDTESTCLALSKRTDEDIKSVFYFIFDGPHPKNDYNEKIYAALLPILTKQNERLGMLLTASYSNVMDRDDAQGH